MKDTLTEDLKALAGGFAEARESCQAQGFKGACARIFVVSPVPDAHGCYPALGTVEAGVVHPALGAFCPRDEDFAWGGEHHDCPPTHWDFLKDTMTRWLRADPQSPKFYAFLFFVERQARAAAAVADAAAAAVAVAAAAAVADAAAAAVAVAAAVADAAAAAVAAAVAVAVAVADAAAVAAAVAVADADAVADARAEQLAFICVLEASK